jgi:hypothetical protein
MANVKRALSRSAVVATAGVIAAACSSPSHPASSGGLDLGACALVSACATNPTTGFGMLCEELATQFASVSEDAAGSAAKPDLALFTCIMAAKDCTALRACELATPAQAAACTSSSVGLTCQGDVLVNCTVAPPAASDCAAVGQHCFQNGMIAECGTAACDATTPMSSCNGDEIVHCYGGGISSLGCGAEIPVTNCTGGPGAWTCVTHAGETCGVVGGTAQCVGAGAACDESSVQASCDGSVVVTCTGGKIGKFDCKKLGPQVTCGHDPTSAIDCVGAGTQCTDETSESCDGSVLTYCMWGTTSTLECKHYGLSGCGTRQLSTGQTIAYCTP